MLHAEEADSIGTIPRLIAVLAVVAIMSSLAPVARATPAVEFRDGGPAIVYDEHAWTERCEGLDPSQPLVCITTDVELGLRGETYVGADPIGTRTTNWIDAEAEGNSFSTGPHSAGGGPYENPCPTQCLKELPPVVIDAAVRAAQALLCRATQCDD